MFHLWCIINILALSVTYLWSKHLFTHSFTDFFSNSCLLVFIILLLNIISLYMFYETTDFLRKRAQICAEPGKFRDARARRECYRGARQSTTEAQTCE